MAAGNFVGTDQTGSGYVNYNYVGILVHGGASSNTIGGTTTAARNVISDNATFGVEIADAITSGNLVEGNWIGLKADGSGTIQNTYGIYVYGASSTTIGGTTAAARNVISGNEYRRLSSSGIRPSWKETGSVSLRQAPRRWAITTVACTSSRRMRPSAV